MKGWIVVVLVAMSATALLGQQHNYTPGDIEEGGRLYRINCIGCHGPEGNLVGGIDLGRNRFRRVTSDDQIVDVIMNGVPGTGMPPNAIARLRAYNVVAYLRNMNAVDRGAAKVGDAARGRTLFEGKGGCTKCHRVGALGSRVAPDLSDIGALRSAGSLLRSITDPTSQMMPINRPVRVVLRDGKVVNGRRLNEDTYTVQLIDDQERLLSLDKSELREYKISTTSPMPSFKGTLSADELGDVVAYLLSLKGR